MEAGRAERDRGDTMPNASMRAGLAPLWWPGGIATFAARRRRGPSADGQTTSGANAAARPTWKPLLAL
jgi:hypothetical protein